MERQNIPDSEYNRYKYYSALKTKTDAKGKSRFSFLSVPEHLREDSIRKTDY